LALGSKQTGALLRERKQWAFVAQDCVKALVYEASMLVRSGKIADFYAAGLLELTAEYECGVGTIWRALQPEIQTAA